MNDIPVAKIYKFYYPGYLQVFLLSAALFFLDFTLLSPGSQNYLCTSSINSRVKRATKDSDQ